MRILILGGFGYLGLKLGFYLASKNLDVTLCGREIPQSFKSYNNIKTKIIDWKSQESIKAAVDSIELIINAAGLNSIECINNNVEAFRLSSESICNLLNIACKSSLKRYIYISSAHVYSDTLQGNITENSPTNNLHPYSISKIIAEKVSMSLCKSNNVNCLIIRLSNVFGTPQDYNNNCWHLFINNLCNQAIGKKEINIYSNSLQFRDFLPIVSFCQSLYKLITLNQYPGYLKDNILNLGSGQSNTLITIAKIVQSICFQNFGFRPSIQRHSEDRSCPNFVYDISKIRQYKIDIDTELKPEILNLLEYLNSI